MPYLNKSDLALADVTVVVFDVDLSVVLDPARSAEKIVDAGCHIFPFIVVSKSKRRDWKCERFSWVHIILCPNRPSRRGSRLTFANAH